MIDELIIYDEDAKLFFETLINSNIQNNNVAGMLFSPGNFMCTAGHKNFYLIGINGDIRKCGCHLEDNHMNKIGCMLENGFMDIDMYKNTRWSIPIASKKCDTCFLSPVCFGNSCCYTNILNGVPKCPKPKKHIDYYLKMADKQGLFRIIE